MAAMPSSVMEFFDPIAQSYPALICFKKLKGKKWMKRTTSYMSPVSSTFHAESNNIDNNAEKTLFTKTPAMHCNDFIACLFSNSSAFMLKCS